MWSCKLPLLPSIHHMRNMLDYCLIIVCTCLKNIFDYINVNINFDFWSFVYIRSNFKSHSFFVPLVYLKSIPSTSSFMKILIHLRLKVVWSSLNTNAIAQRAHCESMYVIVTFREKAAYVLSQKYPETWTSCNWMFSLKYRFILFSNQSWPKPKASLVSL